MWQLEYWFSPYDGSNWPTNMLLSNKIRLCYNLRFQMSYLKSFVLKQPIKNSIFVKSGLLVLVKMFLSENFLHEKFSERTLEPLIHFENTKFCLVIIFSKVHSPSICSFAKSVFSLEKELIEMKQMTWNEMNELKWNEWMKLIERMK